MASIIQGKEYLQEKKKKHLVYGILTFAFMIILIVIGKIVTGTLGKFLIMIAVFSTLAASYNIVRLIIYLPHKVIIDSKIHNLINNLSDGYYIIYSAIITNGDKKIYTDAIVISDESIYFFIIDEKKDTAKKKEKKKIFIEKFLRAKGYNKKVNIVFGKEKIKEELSKLHSKQCVKKDFQQEVFEMIKIYLV